MKIEPYPVPHGLYLPGVIVDQYEQKVWWRKLLTNLLANVPPEDHFTACDKTMGDSHVCSCGLVEVRKAIAERLRDENTAIS